MAGDQEEQTPRAHIISETPELDTELDTDREGVDDDADSTQQDDHPLLSILDDAEGLDDLMDQVSQADFTPERQMRLRQLYKHFCQAVESDHETEGKSKTKAQAKAKAKKEDKIPSQVRRFTAITTLPLPATVVVYIEKWGTNPDSFMDKPMHAHGAGLHPGNTGDTFIDIYNYTKFMIGDKEKSSVQFLFQMLNFYDIGQSVVASKRMSSFQMIAIQEFLTNLTASVRDFATVAAAQDVSDWWKFGAKVNLLCEVFGPGIIFFVANEFSEDFWKNKMRNTGPLRDGIVAHLKDGLGIEAIMEQTQAGELGKRLRAHLMNPFRDFIADRPPVKRRRQS